MSVDNTADTYADGSHVGYTEGWLASMHTTIATDTKVLAVVGYNAGGPAGLLVTLADGLVVSDTSWKCTTSAPSGDCKCMISACHLATVSQQRRSLRGLQSRQTSFLWTDLDDC